MLLFVVLVHSFSECLTYAIFIIFYKKVAQS
jgi:hypothetical protein